MAEYKYNCIICLVQDLLYSGSHNTIEIWDATGKFNLKGKISHTYGSVHCMAITQRYIVAGEIHMAQYIVAGEIHMAQYIVAGEIHMAQYIVAGEIHMAQYIVAGEIHMALYIVAGEIHMAQ